MVGKQPLKETRGFPSPSVPLNSLNSLESTCSFKELPSEHEVLWRNSSLTPFTVFTQIMELAFPSFLLFIFSKMYFPSRPLTGRGLPTVLFYHYFSYLILIFCIWVLPSLSFFLSDLVHGLSPLLKTRTRSWIHYQFFCFFTLKFSINFSSFLPPRLVFAWSV